ncbi:MAG: glycoside hydrolase family 2 TIM barrel-domain containing protein [Clostridia bacterium]|nr:glycoside hydrolase family 2 TIM barrel-domain containing protein [Clostridia bacterium]
MEVYRLEHPNPQWERNNWRNLNGEWEFDFDFGKSARDREIYKGGALAKKINVPFCPESELSGINYKDFMSAVCYRKVITLSDDECNNNVILHFGAVDYESFIYINGEEAGHHIGGFASFSCDITNFVKPGENVVFVIAEDDLRSKNQPIGKQSSNFYSSGCLYTRTTGIWQTVWLEFIPKEYIKNAKYYPDINNSCISITGEVVGEGKLTIISSFEGKETGRTTLDVDNNCFTAHIYLSELHLWEVGKGRLYDLEFVFNNDRVKSYFGMREVKIKNNKFMINNKPVFQRLVLDQGFYRDGIYTAKSDEILKKDIQLSLDAGFNGARLHQKVFEKRFIYHCDKAGYIIWGEHGNWGMDYSSAVAGENFINEWMEIIERDFNSPAIIGWCPFNETWRYVETKQPTRLLEAVYKMTKQLDKTRVCIDTSGNYHVMTDIYDVHDYEQDVENFKENYARTSEGIAVDQVERTDRGTTQQWRGEPLFMSEYGGIRWNPGNDKGWGYGNAPKTEKEYIERYKGLTDAMLDNPDFIGFCFTQLYDVEQEVNGLYTYDREPKFDMKIFKEINKRKAKYEE